MRKLNTGTPTPPTLTTLINLQSENIARLRETHPPQATDEQIAWDLLLRNPGSAHVAFLEFNSKVYFSTLRPEQRFPTRSEVVSLIHGVCQLNPGSSQRILRSRIFTTAPLTEFCRGMIRVVAKRVTASLIPKDHGILRQLTFERIPDDFGAPKIKPENPSLPRVIPEKERALEPESPDTPFITLALRLRDATPVVLPRHQADRPVGALLVSQSGDILQMAQNTHAHNKTLHAEVNLVREFQLREKKPLPSGSRIYTTLKPCKMCAGLIWSAAQDLQNLEVIYFEDDPGPFARSTVLDGNSVDRIRASIELGLPELKALQIQRPFEAKIEPLIN
ncbi:MAG: Bd3614 family nucleic acid deaminase [Bdellovibrionia bacterium]